MPSGPLPPPAPLLVVGDAFADLAARVARFPAEGTDAQVGAMRWSGGGSAANVAAALAALGHRVRLLARVGLDPAAEVALRAAAAASVDLGLVQRDPSEPTGLCFVVVSPGGERTFFSARGANAGLELPRGAAALVESSGALHVSGYSLLGGTHRETALALVEEASARGVPASLDLCLPLVDARRDELLALLPRFAVVLGNGPEIAALGADAPRHGGTALVEKRGRHGCRIASPAWSGSVPGYAVDAVDTTGCGDAFVAGFLSARARGAALPLCGALGNALGALAATSAGSGDALPRRAALLTFLRSLPGGEELLRLVPGGPDDA